MLLIIVFTKQEITTVVSLLTLVCSPVQIVIPLKNGFEQNDWLNDYH